MNAVRQDTETKKNRLHALAATSEAIEAAFVSEKKQVEYDRDAYQRIKNATSCLYNQLEAVVGELGKHKDENV